METTAPPKLTASALYAASQGACNHGTERCHWCGEPCTRDLRHNGPIRLPFIQKPPSPMEKLYSLGAVPGSLHSCHGCWLWRRPSVTVWFLGGRELKDRQSAPNHSWWVTEEGAWALRKHDLPALWPTLLRPPCRFFLSIKDEKCMNHLQSCVANDNPVVDASTELHFTHGNARFTYTTYELEQGIRHGPEGKSPGVRELLNLLGECKIELGEDPQLRYSGMGQPTNAAARAVKKVLRKSGDATESS